jgi:hypothetical protein
MMRMIFRSGFANAKLGRKAGTGRKAGAVARPEGFAKGVYNYTACYQAELFGDKL